MYPDLYRRFSRLISKYQLKSITLDLFDTIILRQIWPEERQFLKVAAAWLPLFQRAINPNITSYELFSWRQYIRHELLHIEHRYRPECKDTVRQPYFYEPDLDLETWFSAIVTGLSQKYQIQFTRRQIQTMVHEMIALELQTEKHYLRPNRHLLAQLQQLRRTFPDLKLYYVSDMYLTPVQIQQLLDYLDIDCFDGGIISIQAHRTKATGQLFYHLDAAQPFPEFFDLAHNLHCGDNFHSDYRMPIQAGSLAYHYRPLRARHLRTLWGRFLVRRQQRFAHRHASRAFRAAYQIQHPSPSQIWQQYGLLFSQPLAVFLHHLQLAAKSSRKTNFLMISSEATEFLAVGKRLLPKTFSSSNLATAPKLNRRTMLRAILWYLAQHQPETNLHVITTLANSGELNGSRREIYAFLFDQPYPIGELTLNARTNQEFYHALLYDIAHAAPHYTRSLRNAYNYVKRFLPHDNETPLVLVDVGWGGTVQHLFTEFIRLHGLSTPIDGLYIGYQQTSHLRTDDTTAEGYLLPDTYSQHDRPLWHAVLWEYILTNKPQFREDASRLRNIQIGLDAGLDLFQKTHLAPFEYYQKIVRPQVKRFVTNPTRPEVQTIGHLRFDQGFARPSSFEIVNFGYTPLKLWRELLRHPRRTVRDIIFQTNRWPGAYINYYHLFGLRRLLIIIGRLRGKAQFF